MQSSFMVDDDAKGVARVAASADTGSSGHWDELRAGLSGSPSASAALAPLWQTFFSSLGDEGWADLRSRHRRVQQRVREDGVTYNVYADRGQSDRPWPLELLPTLISADDWARIETGVVQRARLMDRVLADIYGPQTLLHDGLLPASMVFAHPQYLRAAHGLWQGGQARLHIAAFDLKRRPGGGFSVLAQRVQAPSGLGYLLQNRLIVGPMFQEQFTALRVQRLAASFRSLLAGLMRASPAGERSRIAMLTPGPLNETYFEQVFLARYLGVTLVEGSDLTVRANKLFLKTLRGLEQIHVLLRRVDEEFLDPLELRPDSALGVPGLLQALRAGELVMANPPGAGFLESPGMAAFWPAVAQRILGEPLRLPASTSWWCGEAAVWASQRSKLADFVVAPTFPDSGFGPLVAAYLSDSQRSALAERIDADPAAYTLQARVRLGEIPVWSRGRLQPRSAVIRVFALSDGAGGWRVLPGALTRVAGSDSDPDPAANTHDPWLSMQHGSASVDTWVIASGAVDPSSLLPKPLTVVELTGWHRSVSSRSAENLFWLGRYTERAENALRLVRLALESLHEARAPVLLLLADLLRFNGLLSAEAPSPLKSPRLFERALVQGLRTDQDRPHQLTSVAHSLRSLRACAQSLRERLSPEHWQLIHELGDEFDQRLDNVLAKSPGPSLVPEVLVLLARATTHLAAITGAQTDRMTRDDGWRLLSVGRQVERLHMLSHSLARGFETRVHETDDGFELLLGLFDSVITYRAQFQARREVMPMLHLLVLDTDNTRSLAWVARTLYDRLRKLTRLDGAWVSEIIAALRMPEQWPLVELASTDAEGCHSALIAALRQCSAATRTISDEIGRHLFTHVTSTDRRVWQ